MTRFGAAQRYGLPVTLWSILCTTCVLAFVASEEMAKVNDDYAGNPIYDKDSLIYGEVLSPDCYGCILFLGRNATRPKLTEIVCKYERMRLLHNFFVM